MTEAPTDPAPEPDVTDDQDVLDEDATALPLWKRLSILGWAKVGLISLGLVALVLGAINAWRAEQSLALLVVGVIFVLVSLILGPDWSGIEVAWGNASAKLYRDLSGRLKQAEEASEDPAELRKEVEQLRAELDKRSRQRRTPSRRTGRWSYSSNRGSRPGRR